MLLHLVCKVYYEKTTICLSESTHVEQLEAYGIKLCLDHKTKRMYAQLPLTHSLKRKKNSFVRRLWTKNPVMADKGTINTGLYRGVRT